tara:strand:- start:6620 stop:7576 length:957 start_codon:yes stop_codon:yes gene_type:complete
MKALNEFLNEAKDVGHYERVGNQTIVDSNFVNYSKGCLPDSELVHLGMGDFQLKTPKGNITFNRSGKLEGIGQDFVGRPHRATDDKGGKVLDELIKVMTKKKKAVLSMSGMNEAKKPVTSVLDEMQSYATSFGGSSNSEIDTDKFKKALNKVKLDLVPAKGLWYHKNIVNSKNKVVSGINIQDSTYKIKTSPGRAQWYNWSSDDKVIKHILGSLNEINQYTGEAEKSEKYWDTKFKKAIKLFPTWADEKRDITNEIRQVYNERVLDVIKGDKGYVEPIDRYENDAEVYIKFATDLWNKMKGDVIAKEYALEDYVRWLR